MPDLPAPEPDAPGLSLRLHGEPVLALPDGRRVALEPRAAALLALAALEPGLTRLRAATLLWPDSNDPRRNLRQQLLRFRTQFQRDLLVGQDTLALAEGVALDAGEQPLLGALAFDDVPDFAAWLAQRRREALGARVDAVRTRLAAAEAAGDFDTAVREAEALLALDRRDEAHHRELMRLHYLGGNHGAGLAAFQRLQRMLAEEFGTAAAPASRQLAEALHSAERAAVVSSLAAPAARLPVTLKRPPVMAGRAAELAAVQAALAEGRVVWLEGEAGLGKSRLVSELVGAWRSGAVLAGTGRPGDAGAPYATLARWLAPLLHADLGALGERARRALRHLGGEAPAGEDRSPLRPGDMAQAVAELLALQRTALAVLDDVHFADDATLELVAGLATQVESSQRWLFATRAAEVSAAGRALREALVESQRIEAVALAPLGEADLAELVDALGVEGLAGSALAEPLRRHTGGNPLFVLETLKQGLHDGSLARGELPRPSNVATLIESRLARLSEGALTLARVAAIAGVDFSIELAESAIGARAVQLAGPWQELQDAQVLRDEAFAHDLVSDAVLRGVPQVVARRVHAQCAQWLAEHGGEPARVAQHWWQGGESAYAARAFEEAARRAGNASRLNEEAALWHKAAEAHAATHNQPGQFDALASRIHALTVADLNAQAIEDARQLGLVAEDDLQRVRAARVLVSVLGHHGEFQAAVDAAREPMALARRIGAQEELVRMACPVASSMEALGRQAEAYELLASLKDWVESQGDAELQADWFDYWCTALVGVGRVRDALAVQEEGIRLQLMLGRRQATGETFFNAATNLRSLGHFERACERSAEGLAMMDDDPFEVTLRTIARTLHARNLADTGRYGEALELIDASLPHLRASGSGHWNHTTHYTLATLWLHLGQYARALQTLSVHADDEAQMPPWLRGMRVLLRMEIGVWSGQIVPEQDVLTLMQQIPVDNVRVMSHRVRALRVMPPAAALSQSNALAKFIRSNERFGVLLLLRMQETRAAVLAQEAGRAVQAAREALRMVEEGHWPESGYLPEVHYWAWRALSAYAAKADAESVLKTASEWIRSRALPHVPTPFIDSFLHRNPVNRELLAAASR